MRKWECTTAYEVEKPWTDSERGCEYYFPVLIVLAETRGRAKVLFAEEMEVDFLCVNAKVYQGDAEPDLPHSAYNLTNELVTVKGEGGGWVVYETI